MGQKVNAVQFGGLINREGPEFSGLVRNVKIWGLGKYKDEPKVQGKIIPLICQNLEENLKRIVTNNA